MSFYQNIIPNQLAQAAVTTATATVYTVPTATRTIIKDINITAGSSISVTIYFVPSGGTAGTGNIFLNTVPVNTGSSYFHWVGTQILPAGSTIQGVATGTGGNIFISGGEAT
jgi:hypothetical protein